MEFYLSDANLQKDRFLMQQMTSCAGGYIDLDVFLRCNKILSLTSDIEVLTNAVATSKTLVVDKEKKRVSRLVPYSEPKDVDERTVYVECLPIETDREWIRKVFGACGKIVYISLPRYKSTGDIKGFAFVEYETTESAQKACELINHPPAEAEEKVGRFPRSKQLKQLEKQVQFQETTHGRKRRASESEMEKGTVPKVKRKRTMSEGETEEVQALLTAPPAKQEPPTVRCKHRKSSESRAVDEKGDATQPPLKETPAKEELQAAKSKRRRSSEAGDVGISLESKSETQSKVAETTLKSKKAKRESKAAKQLGEKTDQKQSAKRSRLDSLEDVASIETKAESTKKVKKEENPEATVEAKTKAFKRKAEGDESSEKKAKKVQICDERTLLEAKEELNGEAGDKTKKKKRQKKNKKTKTKDVPELRVIPKKEWLNLRAEYLKLQKANMSQLKEKLKEIRNDERSNKKTKPVVLGVAASEEKESDPKKKSEPEFTEGVIVKVTTDQPISRKDLKERIWAFGSIAYIDIKDRDTLGHVRCNDRETAIAISQASIPGYTFQRLSGVDEQAYWQKLIDDRNKKLISKTRTKQRGKDKILHRADDAYEKVKKPLHIIFD